MFTAIGLGRYYHDDFPAGTPCEGTDNDNSVQLYDEVYCDNSFQRVELGDNPVYANCTHREIQIPTAWAETQISGTLNMGSFGATDDLYMFVVDENNVVSAGFPITARSISKPTIYDVTRTP